MNLYHKKFLNSFTAENVVALFSRYRGAAKEITESWAMLEAAKKYVPNLNDCFVIVVGDGCSPRTGAIMAYYTKAEVLSIDPNFNMAHWKEHVEKQTKMGFQPQRLELIHDKIENIQINCRLKHCVVLWPHSHADMRNANTIYSMSRIDIAMPCCVKIPREWMERPHITFDDYNVLSPQRTIHIWKSDNMPVIARRG